jgi:quercetin dioxygenase-like cupin family protein
VANTTYLLTPGVLIPVAAHAVHNVQAEPEIALLVTFFRQPDTQAGGETTAQFDE